MSKGHSLCREDTLTRYVERTLLAMSLGKKHIAVLGPWSSATSSRTMVIRHQFSDHVGGMVRQ